MKLTYTNVNGYLILNLTYKSGEQMEQLGKYGYRWRSMGYQDFGNRSCAFHSGNLNGDNYGNNKTIQKNVERNFTNVFDWKPFRDSSAWRCNQRLSTCEFDPVICVC